MISTNAETDLTTDTGTGIFGPTRSYPFTVNFPASTGLSGIGVANQRFPLQDSLFIDVGLSSIDPGLSAVSNPTFGVERTWKFNITAAVRSNPLSLGFRPKCNPPALQNPKAEKQKLTTSLSPSASHTPLSFYSRVAHSDLRHPYATSRHDQPTDGPLNPIAAKFNWNCGSFYAVLRGPGVQYECQATIREQH